MTEGFLRKRDAHRVHRLYTTCAPIVCLALFPGAGTVQAGTAWEMFVARCLDPFEHQTVPVIDGLAAQPTDQMHEARRVFGPSAEGYLLVLDAAPAQGERACAVEVPRSVDAEDARAWLSTQISTGRYVSAGDWLDSNEWIEPRVMMRAEMTETRTFFVVVETDFES